MSVSILHGDCRDVLSTLPAGSVQCVVTSPPYWGLRDYGVDGQIGLEATPEAYLETMVAVFREVRRVLREDGTLWLNLGDSYHGGGGGNYGDSKSTRTHAQHLTNVKNRLILPTIKPKDLVGIPWRVAFALQADGWWLRSDIIWAKPNPMPESVTDRPTKAHEYVFLLTKSARYFYDAEAVREPNTPGGAARITASPGTGSGMSIGVGGQRYARLASVGTEANGRNMRSVWTIPSAPFPEAHFATFPPALADRCILAGTSAKGCCPTCGAPWVREVERVSTGKSYATGKSAAKRAVGLATGFSGYDDGSSCPVFRTTGWAPSCGCEAGDPVPCTVLDPFGGSGTVGACAEALGRHSILIELSPEYVAMAKRRTAQRGLFTRAG